MNNGSDNNAEGLTFILLGEFKPIAFFDSNIGIVSAKTKDVSVCSEWHRNLYIETERENHTEKRKMVGFNIRTPRPKSKWLPIFLISVFGANLKKNRQANISNRECFKVYAQVFWLIITHPRLWRITN